MSKVKDIFSMKLNSLDDGSPFDDFISLARNYRIVNKKTELEHEEINSYLYQFKTDPIIELTYDEIKELSAQYDQVRKKFDALNTELQKPRQALLSLAKKYTMDDWHKQANEFALEREMRRKYTQYLNTLEPQRKEAILREVINFLECGYFTQWLTIRKDAKGGFFLGISNRREGDKGVPSHEIALSPEEVVAMGRLKLEKEFKELGASTEELEEMMGQIPAFTSQLTVPVPETKPEEEEQEPVKFKFFTPQSTVSVHEAKSAEAVNGETLNQAEMTAKEMLANLIPNGVYIVFETRKQANSQYPHNQYLVFKEMEDFNQAKKILDSKGTKLYRESGAHGADVCQGKYAASIEIYPNTFELLQKQVSQSNIKR